MFVATKMVHVAAPDNDILDEQIASLKCRQKKSSTSEQYSKISVPFLGRKKKGQTLPCVPRVCKEKDKGKRRH